MEKFKKTAIVFLPVFVWLFYSGIFFIGKPDRHSVDYNYFKFLSYSILNGRLDIDCPKSTGCADLVHYKGKYYLYWPWVPAIVYLPVVAIFGTNTPDVLISSFFGALNVFLIIFFLRRLSVKFGMEINDTEIILLALFWALGTVHFYMSMVGSVWFISQIMAQTFLLSAIVLILRASNLPGFFFSGLFFSMAVYTKNDLLFSIFFLATIWYLLYCRNQKINYTQIAVFFLPFIVFSAVNFVYNYVRFGEIFENGLKYHNLHRHFIQNYKNHGYFSIFYIPYNFYTEVLRLPPFKPTFPFFKYDPEGFGFLWNSPLFFLIFPLFYFILRKKKHSGLILNKVDLILISGTILSLIFISMLIFMIMGTGWAQFASRYSLDYQLMLFVLLIYSFKFIRQYKWFYPVAWFLFFVSFYMNINGVFIFS